MAATPTSRFRWLRRLRTVWRTIEVIRRLLSLVLLLAFVVFLYFLLRGGAPVIVPDQVALVVAPSGNLVEEAKLPASNLLLSSLGKGGGDNTVMRDLLDTLRYAATDSRIKLIVLRLDALGHADMAQLQELASAITLFKQTNKRVIAYSTHYTQEQYYLAVHADQVYLDPYGSVEIDGFGSFQPYFKDALDKLGVNVHIFRVGMYKSAVEPFERNSMSPEAKLAQQAWSNTLWQVFRTDILRLRKIIPAQFDQYANQYSTLLAQTKGDQSLLAEKIGLVDGLMEIEELRAHVAEAVGGENEGLDDTIHSFRQIDDAHYLRARRAEEPTEAQGKIGLIVVEGELVDGESTASSAGADTIAEQIREARFDAVDALVVRVNSPGGSVTAAETIRRELEYFRGSKDDKRPVIISMSGLAASGGYWIASESDAIFAQPSTLTGSIGIFGMIPTFEKPLAKYGVHVDGIGTTAATGSKRLDYLSPDAAQAMQLSVNFGYQDFVSLVSERRKLPFAEAEAIAQGRVWSGSDAKRLKLVDQFGGLHAALVTAQNKAKLSSFLLETYDHELDFKMQLLQELAGAKAWFADSTNPMPDWFKAGNAKVAELTAPLNWMQKGAGLYAHCFCQAGAANADFSAR